MTTTSTKPPPLVTSAAARGPNPVEAMRAMIALRRATDAAERRFQRSGSGEDQRAYRAQLAELEHAESAMGRGDAEILGKLYAEERSA